MAVARANPISSKDCADGTRGLVTRGESVAEIRRALKSERGLPDSGEGAAQELREAANLLFEHGKLALRVCIVNFRTSLVDIEALPPLLSRLGKDVCREAVPRLHTQ